MDKNYTMVLVSHTHWDREWYLPFQEFRIRLVRLTDKLLDILDTDPEFKTFVLDGQTIVLQDYLEIRPEERGRIARFIKSGRLRVGPWYVLPDEYLVSGEATIRNLLLGHLIAEEYGTPMKAGYAPDPFGHISQLPQILQGFGIADFYFSRGLGLEEKPMPCEFRWEAPDGSAVLAVNQPGSYCSACNLGYTRNPDGSTSFDADLAVEKIKSERDRLAPRCASTVLLLNNGCDHLEAQPEIPQIIRLANEKLEDAIVTHGSFEDVGRLIRQQNPDLPTYRGELRAGRYMNLLPGVASTRVYVKQANERTQTLLENWAEPFSALAYAHGGKYESTLLRTAWRTLIQNHPHDSICGCSIDQVHKEMMVRFDQAQQIGRVMVREGMQSLASQVNTLFQMPETASPVVVINALSCELTEPVTIGVSQMLEQGKALGQVVVRDSEGNTLPSQISDLRRTELHRHGLRFQCDLTFVPGAIPALGYKTFSVDRLPYSHPGGRQPAEDDVVTSENTMENEHVRVTVYPNGTFDLLNKSSGNLFTGLNLLEDTEDAGDEYDYSPARESKTVTSSGAAGVLSVAQSGPVFATMRADFDLKLPASLTVDRYSRLSDAVGCPVSVSVTVRSGSPRVDVVTEFTNNAEDHRLRAWFPAGVKTDVSQAEGQFDVVERKIAMPKVQGWWQQPQPEQPQQSFVNVQQKGRGLAVINQGLPECEVMRPDGTVIALTLLRCVGWLSTNDLQTRGTGAGPEIQTPDAQCPGKHVFRYAVAPHSGGWKEARIWQRAHEHNVPLRGQFTSVHPGRLPREKSFLSVSPQSIVVSALKKAERDDSLILRVYNTTADAVTAEVTLGFFVKSAALANLNEEPTGDLRLSNGKLSFAMPPFRVQTVRLTL